MLVAHLPALAPRCMHFCTTTSACLRHHDLRSDRCGPTLQQLEVDRTFILVARETTIQEAVQATTKMIPLIGLVRLVTKRYSAKMTPNTIPGDMSGKDKPNVRSGSSNVKREITPDPTPRAVSRMVRLRCCALRGKMTMQTVYSLPAVSELLAAKRHHIPLPIFWGDAGQGRRDALNVPSPRHCPYSGQGKASPNASTTISSARLCNSSG